MVLLGQVFQRRGLEGLLWWVPEKKRVRRVVNLVQFKVHFLLMLKVVLVFNRGNQARVQEVLLFQVILEYTRVNFFAKEMVDKG